ncbi:hypothetical protein E2I00_000835, partial [Balaenoptera physalus]
EAGGAHEFQEKVAEVSELDVSAVYRGGTSLRISAPRLKMDFLHISPSSKHHNSKNAENAFKVRLSLRTALGDKAYAWDTNEEYLFKAMVAFSMRRVPNREAT